MKPGEAVQRIIIEATNRCNLDCSICLRHSWNGTLGEISPTVFDKLAADLEQISSPPEIFFGGYGEPLTHPRILDMLQRIATAGCRTSLITNGTLLSAQLAHKLADAGLQKLWISIDSSHHDALLRSHAPGISTSLLGHLAEIFQHGNGLLQTLDPGLAFVVTRTNQAEVLDWISQGRDIGIKSFFLTNAEAYTPAQSQDLLYSLGDLRQPGSWRISAADLIGRLEQITARDPAVVITSVLTDQRNTCPFAERGDLVLRWDGELSPCLPLLYAHTTYLGSWEHKQYSHSLGNILERSLKEIWTDADSVSLRQRLLGKEFSPCLSCHDCWFSLDNRQDCQGYVHPTCGGCLWAEGIIDCP